MYEQELYTAMLAILLSNRYHRSFNTLSHSMSHIIKGVQTYIKTQQNGAPILIWSSVFIVHWHSSGVYDVNIFVEEVQLTWEANVILCISGYGIDVKYYSCTFIISTVGTHTKLVLQMGYMCVVYLYQVMYQTCRMVLISRVSLVYSW